MPLITTGGSQRQAPRWTWILFDLDGTLTDPVIGISRSIVAALEARGYPAPEPESLGWAVGPPIRDTFARLVGSGDPVIIEDLVAAFRQRFVPVGLYENTVYPGVAACLEACRQAGCTMAIATAKPSILARRVLQHFGLHGHFAAVVGSYLDGRRVDKGWIIRRAMTLMGADPARGVMIGDRATDIAGARASGLEAIGVTWGYAASGELSAAEPTAVARSTTHLRQLLLP